MSYTLHGFAQSGNAFKVAFMLRALGVLFETRLVDFMHGVTRTPEWRGELNEMGEVPVLDIDAPQEKRRLTQSGVILTWLAGRHGRFLGESDDDKFEALRWLFFDNHKFTSYFASYRFAKAFGPTPPDPAVMKWLEARLDNAFGIVERHLHGRRFLVGDALSIADFSLSGYLFYPVEESGYDFAARFPAIGAWVERLRAAPGWADPYEALPGGRIAPKW